MQPIDQPLLLLLRQIAETRLLTKRVGLACEGLALVALQPPPEMLLIRDVGWIAPRRRS
jgi:hypothetical protein